MSKLGKFNIKGIKEFLGVEDLDNEEELDEELDLFQEEEKKEPPKKKNIKKVEKNSELDEFDIDLQKGKLKEDLADDNVEDYQGVFIDPKDFSDCKKIAKFIKNDRMVTINFEYLDPKKAQRMMDFLMGAMLIKGASFIEISKKVYTSVPKNIKIYHEGKKDVSGTTYSMEQE